MGEKIKMAKHTTSGLERIGQDIQLELKLAVQNREHTAEEKKPIKYIGFTPFFLYSVKRIGKYFGWRLRK